MTPVEKRIARRRLEPLGEYQQRLLSFQPLCEALVDRILLTLTIGGDVFDTSDAQDVLYQRLLDSDPHARGTDDERRSREMVATEDAAFMIGIALGRRLGPQPLKGGA